MIDEVYLPATILQKIQEASTLWPDIILLEVENWRDKSDNLVEASVVELEKEGRKKLVRERNWTSENLEL